MIWPKSPSKTRPKSKSMRGTWIPMSAIPNALMTRLQLAYIYTLRPFVLNNVRHTIIIGPDQVKTNDMIKVYTAKVCTAHSHFQLSTFIAINNLASNLSFESYPITRVPISIFWPQQAMFSFPILKNAPSLLERLQGLWWKFIKSWIPCVLFFICPPLRNAKRISFLKLQGSSFRQLW